MARRKKEIKFDKSKVCSTLEHIYKRSMRSLTKGRMGKAAGAVLPSFLPTRVNDTVKAGRTLGCTWASNL
jgi:hypothetical protein